MPKINRIFMTHREGRDLLLQVSELPKIHLMNLFGIWEVEAPKVGAPSSHVTFPGPLFIGDALDGFGLRFLGDPKRRDVEIIKKNLKKF